MIDEGVIKFQSHWQQQPIQNQPIPDELVTWRNKVYEMGFIGHDAKNDVDFGNISVSTNENVFISGTQTGHIKTADHTHFSRITDYNIARNTVASEGLVEASSESLTHMALYHDNARTNAVAHIHCARLWRRLKNYFPTTDEKIPYGTPTMALEIWRIKRQYRLATSGIIIMGGHQDGIIAFGESIKWVTQQLSATRKMYDQRPAR